ncbi:MAG: XRE family transcriptional regulator [[Eubacterium] rectale]|nr:XRE family transcriptional regulator [Agathobacter rectalis]
MWRDFMSDFILDPQKLGERIRSLRLKMNKNQSYFADMLYISSSYLALIESGKRIPNLDLLIHIAKFTDVSLDYLVYGDDPKLDPLQMTFDRLSSDYSEELMNKALKLAEFYLEMSDDGKKKKQHK